MVERTIVADDDGLGPENPLTDKGFKPKLIIWDLDDTLWRGALAEGDDLVLDERRASFIRTLNRQGIVSAICSKNDAAAAKAALESYGLWDEFVFPRIAFAPKGPTVRQMIGDMQLRPVNVLFVDDNPHNLREVAHAVPGIHVMDANSAACDALLQKIADDHAHIRKSRVADYRMLELRAGERAQYAELSDEYFLMQSGIHATVTYRSDSIEFVDRIEELINRSNQLNYTESRVEPGTLLPQASAVWHYEVMCAFVWDKYGYYGLVGVAVYDRRSRELLHFALSCRIMHMGVEDYLLSQLAKRHGEIGLRRFRKPLPVQSARAITHVHFFDLDIRERILTQETARDSSKLDIRIMADCQSGTIAHYSRFREIMDFDNAPRFFSLPMLVQGCAAQDFPRHLVYTAALDYIEVTWENLLLRQDHLAYAHCVETFGEIIAGGNHKLLVFLPPLDAPAEFYRDRANGRNGHCFERQFAEFGNNLWQRLAARYPGQITCIDQTGDLRSEDMVDTNHYLPSALMSMAAMVDDWYEMQTGSSDTRPVSGPAVQVSNASDALRD